MQVTVTAKDKNGGHGGGDHISANGGGKGGGHAHISDSDDHGKCNKGGPTCNKGEPTCNKGGHGAPDNCDSNKGGSSKLAVVWREKNFKFEKCFEMN